MYAVVCAGQVTTLLNDADAFVLNGHQYPAHWLHHADAATREQQGIFPVVHADHPRSRYAPVSRTLPAWDAAARVVRIGFTLHAFDLTQAQQVEGRAIEAHAQALLAPSVTAILAALDANQPLPLAWTVYRRAVLAEAARLKQALAAASDEIMVIAALQTASWPTQPARQ